MNLDLGEYELSQPDFNITFCVLGLMLGKTELKSLLQMIMLLPLCTWKK